MTEVLYFVGIHSRALNERKYWQNVGGKDLAFWTKNSLFKYRYIICSYPYYSGLMGVRRDDLRKELDIDDDIVIFVDSGGFTFASVGQDVDVEAYAHWCNRNSIDFCINPDVPVSVTYQGVIDRFSGERSEQFVKKAMKTYDRTKLFLNKLDDNIKVFLALHGGGIKELELWWEYAIEPFLDRAYGIAFAPHPYRYLSLQLLWLIENFNTIRNIHMLGVSSSVGVLAYLIAKLFPGKFDMIGFDSATPHKASARARFIIPYTCEFIDFGLRGKRSWSCDEIPKERICECPVCNYWVSRHPYELLLRPDDFESYQCLALHNQWALSKFYALAQANPKMVASKLLRRNSKLFVLWYYFSYGLRHGLQRLEEIYAQDESSYNQSRKYESYYRKMVKRKRLLRETKDLSKFL
ncbi:MAG: hypothetical protein QXW42_04355 [Thermofilum sp.]